ncbi:hypothetical protein Lser_V15G24535 [Lactuca serriola]
MAFSSYCRRAVNGSRSLFSSMISSSQTRSKHSISHGGFELTLKLSVSDGMSAPFALLKMINQVLRV